MSAIIDHLEQNEYAPYYRSYIERVENANLVSMMIEDLEKQLAVIEAIPEDKFNYSYQEGKWTIAELIIHLFDSESVFFYRALCFSRNDHTNIPGFDQDEWVKNSKARSLSKKNIIGLYKTTRNNSISLYKSLDDEQLLMNGTANHVNFSVRALGYIILGHNRHHFEILNNYYLTK